MDKEKLAIDISKKVIDKQVKPHLKKVAKKLQGRAIASLSDLGIEEDLAEKSAAALAIGKAVAEKKFKYKINKNLAVDIDANKGREKIGIFYNKRF